RTTNTRLGLVPFDLMGCADNLPAFASNNDHLHGRVLAVIDLQVTKQNNFKHEWNVNGALVSDLKLVEHLWRILIAGAAATFREVINYEFVLGGIVPSTFSLWRGSKDDGTLVGSLSKPVPPPVLCILSRRRTPPIEMH